MLKRFLSTTVFVFYGALCPAEITLPENYEIPSPGNHYLLKFESLTDVSTGTLSLLDRNTSSVLIHRDIVPGKLRSRPRAVWRGDSADVAIELDTYNACSPAYVFFHARKKGYVSVEHGNLASLAGYLGVDAKSLVQSRFSPVQWSETPVSHAQVIIMHEQCWNTRKQRFTRSREPIMLSEDGNASGR